MRTRSSKIRLTLTLALTFAVVSMLGTKCSFGLLPHAFAELQAAGVDKYVGEFTPAASEDLGNGWTKHTFDTDGGDGPICIAGTPFTSFTQENDPEDVLIFLNGGGACWQDFYNCSILATDVLPSTAPGIFADSYDTGSEVIENPFADWSKMFVSYCDGSVHSGDNDVVDANFPFGPVRFHRGLRNMTAALDLARAEFPNARRVMLAGSSAGGVGAAGFAPFVFRFIFGNDTKLRVFNDAGPVAINPADVNGIAARAADWQFGQFYPASCTECDALGNATAPIEWRLDNDWGVREAFYSTDGDATNRFFMMVPTQEQYREILLQDHGALNESHPLRYKSFIRSGDTEHTALGRDTFYEGTVDGKPLYEWTDDFINKPGRWHNLIEDFIPAP